MLRAGFGLADITPEGRVDLNGFAARPQPSTGVGAPVRGRVVFLQSRNARAVIAVCDTLGFTVANTRRLEAAIARASGASQRNVLLACTHTHSGPMSMPLGLVGRYRPSYIGLVERKLARAAAEARDDAVPVTAATFGTHGVPGLGAFRCALEEPGRDQWPGVLSVLRLERRDTGPITIWHAGVHPYVLGFASRVLHPDFPGPACEAIERTSGGQKSGGQKSGGQALFLPGCGADVSPVPQMRVSLAVVERCGRAWARAVDAVAESARPIDVEPLRARLISPRVRFGFLPRMPEFSGSEEALRNLAKAGTKLQKNFQQWHRQVEDGSLPRTASFPTHFLKLGDVLLVGMPAELFCDTGIDLEKALPGAKVLVVSHAGGNLGYLPRPFSYRRRTYESTSAHQWYRTPGAMARGTEAAVRKAAVRTARQLQSGGGSCGN